MYYIPLESYKDKLFNKLHFIGIVFESLKVIGEKTQVNQVVPYRMIICICTIIFGVLCIMSVLAVARHAANAVAQ